MGLMDKLTGRAKKAAGDIADDASLRREGRQEERKGEAKDDLARSQEKADRKADEVADLERRNSASQAAGDRTRGLRRCCSGGAITNLRSVIAQPDPGRRLVGLRGLEAPPDLLQGLDEEAGAA